MKRKFGFHRAHPHKFGAFAPSSFKGCKIAVLPPHVDFSAKCPPVYDQGELGSCTANAMAGAFETLKMKAGAIGQTPSRLFLYYFERVLEGTVQSDSGATLTDSVKAMQGHGIPLEIDWPYQPNKFAMTPPRQLLLRAAPQSKISAQAVIQILDDILQILANNWPLIFGISVYDSFMTPQVEQTGIVPMPGPNENLLGGHAIMACGYDTAAKTLLCRNSWGSSWGKKGYFTLPLAYVLDSDLASDFWAISAVPAAPMQ